MEKELKKAHASVKWQVWLQVAILLTDKANPTKKVLAVHNPNACRKMPHV